ncbi:hypothetical protein C8R42DRAFT_648399 [Lentinula raphanica]|nr:hypothetical protein C8R42DRAFT_648399 [Lentinula raphanica]
MRSYLLTIPNELLHSIVDYIAYTSIPVGPPDSAWFSKSLVKYVSPYLLALSSTNWQLRRVCLPFLFAYITIRHEEDVTRIMDYTELFSEFTKYVSTLTPYVIQHSVINVHRVLVIGIFHMRPGTTDQLISQILPRSEQLSEVELQNCRTETVLLRAILARPTVTSVLVHELPDPSMCNDDLSKVTLSQHSDLIFSLDQKYESYMSRGMRLMRFELFGSLNAQFQPEIFSGLKEIQIHMNIIPKSFSWLPLLSSTHPNLDKVWLLNVHQYHFTHDTPHSLTSFIGELQQQGLYKFFNMTQVGLCRNVGQLLQGWYVMGFTLMATISGTSLIEVLVLAASFFPKLEVFTLDLCLHNMRYDIDDLVSALAHFPSLQVLSLNDVFYWLDFESGNRKTTPVVTVKPTKSLVDVFHELRARYESGLSLFTSCLAEQVRSLDSVHINDKGYDSDVSRGWYLSGWIHVLNGNRDVGGTLHQYDVYTRRRPFV